MKKIKWHDAAKTQPCNRTLCIVQLSDLSFAIDRQSFGEWEHKNVIKWCHYDDKEFNALIVDEHIEKHIGLGYTRLAFATDD